MSDKKDTKRYATRYGLHYSIVMKPSVTQIINGMPINTPDKTITFENGVYETSDKAEQKFLDTCPQNGRDFREVTGEVQSAMHAQSLEDREKEIAAREADLKRREMELRGQGHEEGARTPAQPKDGKEGKEKEEEEDPVF